MRKKSKIIIARIMAILMMLSILPADLSGVAVVAMAKELEEDAKPDLTVVNPEIIGGIPESGDVSTETMPDPDNAQTENDSAQADEDGSQADKGDTQKDKDDTQSGTDNTTDDGENTDEPGDTDISTGGENPSDDEDADNASDSVEGTKESIDITLSDETKDIITSAVIGKGAAFVNKETKEDVTPTEITLNVTSKSETTVEDAEVVKAAVESQMEDWSDKAKKDAKKLYYDLIITDQDDVAIDLKKDSGVITIKMPYSISEGADSDNEIIVIHGTKALEVEKDEHGFSFGADGCGSYAVMLIPQVAPQADENLTIINYGGYEEGAYAEWEDIEGIGGYRAYIKAGTDGEFIRLDNELIRKYENHWRVDAVGLAAGTYYIKIEGGTVKETDGVKDLDAVTVTVQTEALSVSNYDRTGFAFSSKSTYKTGSGAYNDNGTLREGAQVVYVTPATAKTCKAMVHTDGANKAPEEIIGFQSILDAKQKKGSEDDIIDFRIIGCINLADLDHISSAEEGLQVKAPAKYGKMNVTIEGIGEDAVCKGFGFLIRNCGNVELRNFALMNFIDDGVSLDTGNENVWVHNLDIFYGGTGGDSDQAKGDGSVDIKGKSTNITISYNHFWDSGKCSLCGMGDSEEFMITYHHNWFDHSDSRHPRIRVATVHIYNNYFDGNSKYGVGTTKGSSAFVEANYFRNSKYPMMSSLQGTDLLVVKVESGKGVFSKEPGGSIKAYNNAIVGAHSLMYANVAKGEQYGSDGVNFDAYLAKDRGEEVPASYVTVSGGTKYNNFDTNTSQYNLGVEASQIDAPEDVPRIVTSKAGRLNGGDFKFSFSDSQDTNYDIITELKSKVVGYTSSIKSIGGVNGVSSSGSNTPIVTPPSAPYADKAQGEVAVGTQVTLKTDTEDAKIHYTIDGTEPTESSPVYNGPITIDTDTVIRAIAVKNSVYSQPVIFTYTVPGNTSDDEVVKAPTASQPSGIVDEGTTITLINNETGATVYYTTDGSIPSAENEDAESFDGESKDIVIAETTTIRAIAVKESDTSRIATFIYTVEEDEILYAAAPKSDTAPGKVEKGKSISLTTDTTGDDVKIYYTTDGSEPNNITNDNTFLYYDGAIVINKTTTIKAYTTKPGYVSSGVSTYRYTVSSGTTVQKNTYEFNPQEIAVAKGANDNISISQTVKYGTPAGEGQDGYFTLINKSGAASTFQTKDSKGVKVSANAPENSKSESGITTYEWQYKFGATSGKDNRIIEFTTKGTATVTICAYVAADKANAGRKITFDADAKKLTATPTEYSYENVAAGKHQITAKEGDYYILYIVVEEEETIDNIVPEETPYNAEITADPMPGSEPVKKGIQVTLSCKDSSDKIYYTTDNTDPRAEGDKSSREEFKEKITLTESLTIKAVARKTDESGDYSTIAIFRYTVENKNEEEPGDEVDGESWSVELKQASYVYTGSEIRPEFTVYGNKIYDNNETDVNAEGGKRKVLVEGVDYTVKYSNNINASVKRKGNTNEFTLINDKKQPTITITGKGIMTGKEVVNFEIRPKDISKVLDNTEPDTSIAVATIVIEKNKKAAAPVICYNGKKLTTKDYDYDKANPKDKVYNTVSDSESLKIAGKGNFEGELSIPVKVVEKGKLKENINKFKVTINSNKAKSLIYSGNPQDILSCIESVTPTTGADKGKNLVKDANKDSKYTVVLPSDIEVAGSVKFMVVGLGDYSGCTVSKSVKIQPRTITGTATTGTALDKVIVTGTESCSYKSTGAVLSDLKVTWQGSELTNGKDYRVSYSGNKRIGDAKCNITFKGNFKGKLAPISFKVEQASLNKTDGNVKVYIPDKVCKDNANCKSTPYVTADGILVKSSEYEVTYSVGDENGTYQKNAKVQFASETSKTIYVKIKAKGKNYKTDNGSDLIGQYTVWKKDAAKKDLSKAKVTFYSSESCADKDKITKLEYTGNEVEPKDVKVTIGKDTTNYAGSCDIIYVNNINKGKATVIVRPKSGEGNTAGLIGSKIAKFNITAKNAGGLKASVVGDILDKLNLL